LEELKDKWFRPEMVRLLRLEDETDEKIGLNVDLMPSWASNQLRALLCEFTDGPSFFDLPAREFITSEGFGQILGMKCIMAYCEIRFSEIYSSADDASKAKFTKAMGGPEIINEIKSFLPDARRILAIERKAFVRVRKQSLIERGRFFKGYGRGLVMLEKILDWVKNAKERKQKTNFIRGYIFLNWQQIEAAQEDGGWPAIFAPFQESIPENTDISDDALEKTLKRDGIGRVGKVGRPKKPGLKSSKVS
jgi:hypothetical protein